MKAAGDSGVFVVGELARARLLTLELHRRHIDSWVTDEPGNLVGTLEEAHPGAVILELPRHSEELERLIWTLRALDVPLITWNTATADDGILAEQLDAGAADALSPQATTQLWAAQVARVIRDRRARNALRSEARTDGLTGLPNVRGFQMRLTNELNRAERYGYPLSLLVIDVDHLKHINDGHGHEAGSRALVRVAQILKQNLRASDFAARYGGDEFVVVLSHQKADEAVAFAERVRGQLGSLVLEQGGTQLTQLPITVSVGISDGVFPLLGNGEALFRTADRALYDSKNAGRDRVTVRTLNEVEDEAGEARGVGP